MKQTIAILLMILSGCSKGYSHDKPTHKDKLRMKCKYLNNNFEICENNEVKCYLFASSTLSCKFK